MEGVIRQLLHAAKFHYQEVGVIERIKNHLALKQETEGSLGRRLRFLHMAAKEWHNTREECTFFLTVSSSDIDYLCVVTRVGTPIAWLNLYL